MIAAFYCVAINGVLPILWAGVAKATAGFQIKHNTQPREFLGKQTGMSVRANAAQANAWEAFAPFAAAVIIAFIAGADQSKLNTLALCFTGLRVVYGVLYITNLHLLRSLVWSLALLCNLACYGLLVF